LIDTVAEIEARAHTEGFTSHTHTERTS